MPVVDVQGVGKVEFPDTMSEDEIVKAIETDILPNSKAVSAAATASVSVGRKRPRGLPAEAVNFREPTAMESVKSAATNVGLGAAEGILQGATMPIDVSLDMATAGPLRRVLKGDQTGRAPLPLTDAVTRLVDRRVKASKRAIGVSDDAITDTADALSRATGNAAAAVLVPGLERVPEIRSKLSAKGEVPRVPTAEPVIGDEGARVAGGAEINVAKPTPAAPAARTTKEIFGDIKTAEAEFKAAEAEFFAKQQAAEDAMKHIAVRRRGDQMGEPGKRSFMSAKDYEARRVSLIGDAEAKYVAAGERLDSLRKEFDGAANAEAAAPPPEPPQKPPEEPPASGGGDQPDKYARPSAINLNRLDIEDAAKQKIRDTAEEIAPDLEGIKGRKLTNDEVVEAAAGSHVLQDVVTRADTLETAAALLRTRQHLAALAEGKGATREFVETLKTVSSHATERGRQLQALSIGADPALDSVKVDLTKKLLDIGVETDTIVKAADGVDWTDGKQVTDFYRKFVKAKLGEKIDEFRYINMLSSPKTHIVNAFSNLLQATVLRPATRLASGAVDAVAATLTGGQRAYYVRQVPAYYKGMLNATGDAAAKGLKALKGRAIIERPDVGKIPTGSRVLAPLQIVTRAMEASDVFFRTLIEGGEFEALAYKSRRAGKPVNEAQIAKESARTAEESVFRKPIDPANETGQGYLLSNIDKATKAIYDFRKVPGVKWFIPFVQTPVNILKQGIEFSPLGFGTLVGSTRKTEQIAKAMVGSTVFAGAGALALNGRTTWNLPTNRREKEAFFAAGLQPYSVKIGDKWVSYTKLGPLAYPIAMAAAIRHYTKDNPEAATDEASTKMAKVLGGIAEFFADQSYVQGLGDLLDIVRGDEAATSRLASNLPTQVVPLSGLQRWVTNIIDPVYRKTARGVSVESIIENVKKGIPGLSYDLPAYKTPSGQDSERQMPGVNAVSPVTITEETPDIRMYRARQRAAQRRAEAKARQQDRE